VFPYVSELISNFLLRILKEKKLLILKQRNDGMMYRATNAYNIERIMP